MYATDVFHQRSPSLHFLSLYGKKNGARHGAADKGGELTAEAARSENHEKVYSEWREEC
jgi:hypothetical protein